MPTPTAHSTCDRVLHESGAALVAPVVVSLAVAGAGALGRMTICLTETTETDTACVRQPRVSSLKGVPRLA